MTDLYERRLKYRTRASALVALAGEIKDPSMRAMLFGTAADYITMVGELELLEQAAAPPAASSGAGNPAEPVTAAAAPR